MDDDWLIMMGLWIMNDNDWFMVYGLTMFKVVPQFGIAKLVNITTITIWFLLVIYL